MKKSFFIFCLMLYSFYSATLFAQNQHLVDSMLNVLKNAPNDTNNVNLFLDIGYEYEGTKPIKASEYYMQALNVAQQMKNPLYLASCFEYLGIVYQHGLAKYDTAEAYYVECLNIRKKVLGEAHPDYANSITNLGVLYYFIGNYEKAEPLFVQALHINKKVLGENNPDYATSLNNLAALYDDMGNYQKAEPLYVQAMNIDKKALGEDHPGYSHDLNNLAELYYKMGNYERAEPLYVQALKIRKEVLGEDHPSYAVSLSNIAALYQEMGNYQKAEPLFMLASQIIQKALGEDHPDYAQSLNNLANLYQEMGNFQKAETLFVQSLQIDKKVLGEDHPSYATSLNNLAALHDKMGNYQKAEPMYIQAKQIWKKVLGEDHPDYATSLNNLAELYFNMGNFGKAEPLYINGLDIINRNIQQNFTFLSEKEKELYFKKQQKYFTDFYSFALNRKNENPEITKMVFNCGIKNKGLLLKSSSVMRTAIINSNDTALIAQYEKWIGLKKEILKLNSIEIGNRKKNPELLEQQANDIEKNLVRGSQIFSDFERMQNLTWESVKNNLKPTEVAIEFVQFEEKKDTVIYCALIVKPDSKQPEMIKLCEEYKLASVVKKLSDNDQTNVNNIYGTNESTKEQLYQLIWQPLEKQLKGIKTVYYSPDGLLHKVSFAAIGNDNGYLCDLYNLKQLSSTAKVAIPEIFSMVKDISVGIIGGIEYSNDTTGMKLWDYLPGTLSETNKIEQIFKTKKIKTNYLVGINANETNFKETAETCNLLHISTHGFFYPDQENLKTTREKKMAELQYGFLDKTNSYGLWQFVKNKNPLMRSGLALALANNVWNQRFPSEGEDGVLTANEVAQLNLQNTQLVVLSACETGLGDIKGSEGVYGLQRAFKMAGVKYIIMSLWQVPDKETVEFMTTFYTKLLKQKDIRKAFTETQNEMRKKYDPYYWAAFVLIE